MGIIIKENLVDDEMFEKAIKWRTKNA